MHAPNRPEQLTSRMMAAAGGAVRWVGVEIEFLGPSARVAAAALARNFGGTVETEDPHALKIRGTTLGDMSVETDLRHVHPARHPDLTPKLPAWAAAVLGTVVSPVVPRELITAPMPASQLASIDEALATLRSVGARGRGTVLLASLGLHFNIDPPSLDASTITAYLKAFLLISDRLRRQTARGSLRYALALPPDYPKVYKERVLAPDYWPDLPNLAADYLADNPTRKRALDLLPLFAHLDENQVRSALPNEKIGPRPVFHYRLPHAHLSDPNWSVLSDWQGWLAVEQVVAELGRSEGCGGAVVG